MKVEMDKIALNITYGLIYISIPPKLTNEDKIKLKKCIKIVETLYDL